MTGSEVSSRARMYKRTFSLSFQLFLSLLFFLSILPSLSLSLSFFPFFLPSFLSFRLFFFPFSHSHTGFALVRVVDIPWHVFDPFRRRSSATSAKERKLKWPLGNKRLKKVGKARGTRFLIIAGALFWFSVRSILTRFPSSASACGSSNAYASSFG